MVIPSNPPGAAAFLAGGISQGGCSVPSAHGTFFWISTAGSWKITSDLGGHINTTWLSVDLYTYQ